MLKLSDYLCDADVVGGCRFAVAPDLSRAEAVDLALRISAACRQRRVQNAALWFDDAAMFACALMGCAHAGVNVLLPPNVLADNIAWAEDGSDIWLSNVAGKDFAQQNPLLDVSALAEMLPAPAHQCADIAIFLKTSASSGAAKIIRKRLGQMQRETQALLPLFAHVSADTVVLGSVAPQHLYGLTFRIMLPLMAGLVIGRTQYVYPETLFAAGMQHDACLWITSPALLHRLGEHSAWGKLGQRVCGVVSSGGALSAQTASWLRQERALPLCEIYGSSETGVVAHRIEDAAYWQWMDGVVHGENDDGALWVTSAWTDGVQQTADVVHETEHGFELLGRQDRVIKLEDKRVALTAIEHQLLAHEWVDDACCSRVAGRTHLGAWLALSDAGINAWRSHGRAALIDDLKTSLRLHFDAPAVPRYWRFIDALPRNEQAKIKVTDIASAFAAQPQRPDWTRLPDSEVGEVVFSGRVPLDLVYFGGHFATFPLVPGVVELRWVLELAREVGLLDGRAIARVENLKYQHFLRPHDQAYMTLRWDAIHGKLYFSCRNDEAVCASGRVVPS